MNLPNIKSFSILLLCLFTCSILITTEGYDPRDPNGNITIKWDVMSWTPDGYVAVVTIYNYQQHRQIKAPGWRLEWTWAEKEIIWSMFGARAIEQGDCSRFKGSIPHSCQKTPIVRDLPPGTPYNQQVANCCRGGVIGTRAKHPTKAASAFQITVGASGNTNRTVKLPKNFTFRPPGLGYTCGAARLVAPTRFLTADRRRMTQAMMTWKVWCTYSSFLAVPIPTTH